MTSGSLSTCRPTAATSARSKVTKLQSAFSAIARLWTMSLTGRPSTTCPGEVIWIPAHPSLSPRVGGPAPDGHPTPSGLLPELLPSDASGGVRGGRTCRGVEGVKGSDLPLLG